MQFGQPCSFIFAKVLKKVVWKSKSGQEKHILYFKIVVFSQNVTLDTQIAVLASLPKLFRQKSEMFSLKIWKPKKSVVLFSGKKASSKRSDGHVECIFDKPVKNFLPKIRLFWWKWEKNCFPSKCSPGHADCSFGQRAKIVSSNIRNVFAQKLKTKKSVFFSPEKSFLKMFPWTPILHFWLACQKNSAKTWKSSCRKSRILVKRFFHREKNHRIFPL